MSDDHSLDDFEGGDGGYDRRPVIYLAASAQPVRHEGDVVGYVDRDPERGVAFCTHRHADKHYFNIYDGYAISLSILAKAQGYEADYVYIWVKDQKKTLVFLLDQYLNGQQVDDDYTPEGEDQRVVNVNDARETWNDQDRPDIDIRPLGKNERD